MPTSIIDRREVLNRCNLSQLDAALQPVKLGNVLSTIKAVVTGLTAIAAIDLTAAAVKAGAVLTGYTLATDEQLPPIGHLLTLRVTASPTANTVGTYLLTDTGGTGLTPTNSANIGVARLSDDGKTITFLTTITAFTIEYVPRPAVATNIAYANGL